jgi:pimeloyl-ACP methyl ester carboxylesterase
MPESSHILSNDDALEQFEAHGALPLPATEQQRYIEHDGARIWYASYGTGASVVLLHGGLGHSGNWGYQIPALVANGYRAIVVDSRGHGRSTRDSRPLSYQLMASDVLAVMDELTIERTAMVGWSDGAVIALTAAMQAPKRVERVFFFACNVDTSGTKPLMTLPPIVERCFHRHIQDYAALSATPDDFKAFHEGVTLMMSTQPNYTADQLAAITVPVTIAQGEHDEFITPEHAAYLSKTIPGAELVILEDVSHFAPLQRPSLFNEALLLFLKRTYD